MRTASSLSLAMLLVVAAPALMPKGNTSLTTTQVTTLDPGGRIDVIGCAGNLHVIGWDEPRVEVVVKRTLRPGKNAAAVARAEAELKAMKVNFEETEPGHLVIEPTDGAARELLRLIERGKVELSVEIRVPRDSDLLVQHDMGDVRIEDVNGDVTATSRTGEVLVMRTPEVA